MKLKDQVFKPGKTKGVGIGDADVYAEWRERAQTVAVYFSEKLIARMGLTKEHSLQIEINGGRLRMRISADLAEDLFNVRDTGGQKANGRLVVTSVKLEALINPSKFIIDAEQFGWIYFQQLNDKK